MQLIKPLQSESGNLLTTSATNSFPPGLITLLASLRKFGKLVPISERQKTPTSSTFESNGTLDMSV